MVDDKPPELAMYLIDAFNFFKFGRTKQELNKRMRGYPKGSVVVHVHNCNKENIVVEKELKISLCSKFIHRKDLGAEYIEGNYNLICKTFMEHCLQDLEC